MRTVRSGNLCDSEIARRYQWIMRSERQAATSRVVLSKIFSRETAGVAGAEKQARAQAEMEG